MKEKLKGKGMIITIGVAAVMVIVSVILLNTLLPRAAAPEEDVVHVVDAPNNTLSQPLQEADGTEGLNIVVYLSGNTIPANSVTAQYVVAATSEISQRVFDETLTGRVFINLLGQDDSFDWYVTAEVENGVVFGTFDAFSGSDLNFGHSAMETDWEWFDSWNEEIVEKERLEVEKEFAELPPAEEIPPEELTALYEVKRQGMMEFAASKEALPHGAKAVDIVNETDLGDGAKPVSGRIMMEGNQDDSMTYQVEVSLDNGKYLEMTLDQTTMELLGYERLDRDLALELYGPKNG